VTQVVLGFEQQLTKLATTLRDDFCFVNGTFLNEGVRSAFSSEPKQPHTSLFDIHAVQTSEKDSII